VEDFPVLCSFSVGEDDDRRSVVCLQELVLRYVIYYGIYVELLINCRVMQ